MLPGARGRILIQRLLMLLMKHPTWRKTIRHKPRPKFTLTPAKVLALRAWLSEVDPDRKERARDYVDCIELETVTRNHVQTCVYGHGIYDVDLRFSRKGVIADCSCPDAQENGFECKHQIALALHIARGAGKKGE